MGDGKKTVEDFLKSLANIRPVEYNYADIIF